LSRLRHQRTGFKSTQRGFFLVLLVLTFLVIGGILFVAIISKSTGIRAQKTLDDQRVLERTKQALFGYVVKETTGTTQAYRLGNLPAPDIVNTSGNAFSFDGLSDFDLCLSASASGLPAVKVGTSKRCLGRIPWRDLGLDFGTTEQNDPLGAIPWLAISPNIHLQDDCLGIINSELLSYAYSGYNCPTYPSITSTLPYPWLKVRDAQGNILSDRVAAVLILPGPPIQTVTRNQTRVQNSANTPNDYLDVVKLPLGCAATCVSTYDNAGLSNEFIQIARGTRYPLGAEQVGLRGENVRFNDQLVYITIDELMTVIELRVAAEMKSAMEDYKIKTGKYSWAAPWADPTSYNSFVARPTATYGLFPFFVAQETNTPLLGYPDYPSDFDWDITVTGASNTNCVSVQTGPSRFIDTNDALAKGSTSKLTPGAPGLCKWRGTKRVSCTYKPAAPLTANIVFNRYATAAQCRGKVNSVDTETRQVKFLLIDVDIGATCNNSPATTSIAYFAGSASSAGTWDWTCSSVNSFYPFKINGTYDVPSLGITKTDETILSNGRAASIKRMLYQPQMPYWYYFNEWHKLGRYAVSNASGPSNSGGCGGQTTLVANKVSGNGAIVLQTSARMGTQARPSASIADYVEGVNVTAATDCEFSFAMPPSTSVNDKGFSLVP
jgi:hypothetical protein